MSPGNEDKRDVKCVEYNLVDSCEQNPVSREVSFIQNYVSLVLK